MRVDMGGGGGERWHSRCVPREGHLISYTNGFIRQRHCDALFGSGPSAPVQHRKHRFVVSSAGCCCYCLSLFVINSAAWCKHTHTHTHSYSMDSLGAYRLHLCLMMAIRLHQPFELRSLAPRTSTSTATAAAASCGCCGRSSSPSPLRTTTLGSVARVQLLAPQPALALQPLVCVGDHQIDHKIPIDQKGTEGHTRH